MSLLFVDTETTGIPRHCEAAVADQRDARGVIALIRMQVLIGISPHG